MEYIASFGWTFAGSTLTLTGFEPVLWGATALIALSVGLIGRDALEASGPGEGAFAHEPDAPAEDESQHFDRAA